MPSGGGGGANRSCKQLAVELEEYNLPTRRLQLLWSTSGSGPSSHCKDSSLLCELSCGNVTMDSYIPSKKKNKMM